MNDKKITTFSGKNKNIIGFGSIILVATLVGSYYYFFTPTVAQNMDSNVLDVASGTDNTISDVDVSSSTDGIVPLPSHDPASDQDVTPKKTSKALSAKKNISTADDADGSDNDIVSVDENSSDALIGDASSSEHNSSSATISVSSCPFPNEASVAPSRKIIFNEIAWMGSVSSSAAEWMEIKNDSANAIDISGWELLSASGKIKILLPAGDSIPAGGLLLLSRNNSSTGISYSGDLSNSGEVLAIIDPQCTVSDLLDASSGWPAGNNKTKQTLERDGDDVGWHTSVLPGGTPDAENSVIAPANQAGPANNSLLLAPEDNGESAIILPPTSNITSNTTTVTIISTTTASSTGITTTPASTTVTVLSSTTNKVLIAAVQIAGASSTNDFVKLYNPNGNSIDMSDWKLHKRSSTGTDYSLKVFPTGSVIAPGQTFIWANSANGFSETIGANVSSTETLSADNSVALLDANGGTIDAVAWGNGTGQYGEGPPYPTDPIAGQLLIRQHANGSMVDTSNNANDFILQ